MKKVTKIRENQRTTGEEWRKISRKIHSAFSFQIFTNYFLFIFPAIFSLFLSQFFGFLSAIFLNFYTTSISSKFFPTIFSIFFLNFSYNFLEFSHTILSLFFLPIFLYFYQNCFRFLSFTFPLFLQQFLRKFFPTIFF